MPTRGNSKRGIIAVLFAVIVILFIIFLKNTWSISFRSWFSSVQENLLGSFYNYTTSFSSNQEGKSLGDYEKLNQDLSQQVADLAFQISTLERLKSENEQLRELLSYKAPSDYLRIGARVIGVDSVLQNSLIISVGSQDGVFAHDAVITGQGTLIGVVIEVKATTSTILLLTDNQVRVAISRPGQSKPIGVSRGTFGLGVDVDYIPQTEKIEVNDVIVTAGHDAYIPEGLVVGRVNRITSTDNDLFKQITLLPFVDYQQVTEVAVIHKM